MDTKIHKQLEQAKAHFYAWRMLDAYNIFRRFFDRIPFRPEKLHAEYIGMFVRVLAELGRISELKFYVGALERHYERARDPAVGYALGFVYMMLPENRPEATRRVCEELIREPAASEYHAKAKVMLAIYYDRFKGDDASVRTLIESIGEVPDPSLQRIVKIWWGKIHRDAKRFGEAERVLQEVIQESEHAGDWYSSFSAIGIYATMLVRTKRIDEAVEIIEMLRGKFAGRNFKSVQVQLTELQSLVEKEKRLAPLFFIPGDKSSTFVYSNQPLVLKRKTASERLLVMLLRKRMVDKRTIVRNLFNREYEPERDDKVVYYHIHTLRKRLQTIGLPKSALVNEGEGYRWIPEVKTVGEEACA